MITRGGYSRTGGAPKATIPITLGGSNGMSNVQFHGRKTTAGAPASGTWAVGDLVIDSAGAWHLCTAAGTPGTWT